MAIERRDIELAIRAKDQASPTFARTKQAVDGLTRAIETQAKGVRSGETALNDLRDTYRELETVAKSLGQQQGLIDSLRRQTEALTKFEQKANEARQKADAYGQTLAQQATVSVRAEQRLAALNRTAERTAGAYARQQERVESTTRALEAAGIDTRNLDDASKSLLATGQRVGAAFTTLNTVMSGYAKEVKAGQAAEREAAATQAATLERRRAALKAFNDQIKEQGRLRAAVLAAETAAAREANAEAEAVKKQTAAYQEQAAAVDRLLSSRGRLSGVNVQLAREQGRGGAEAAVRSITQPGSQVSDLRAIQTTAAAQARAVQDSLGKPVNNYLGLLQDLERSLANVQRVAKQVDGYQAQRNATVATLEAYRNARDNLRRLNAELRNNPTAANAAAVRAAVPAYERARAAFQEQYQALRVLREGLNQANVSAKDFAATERTLVQITERTSKAIKDLNRNFDQFGGSRREGPAGFLGLRPYELQNLSFQINDFFTQLASGASVTQAFAQQAGQVAQIQPIWTRITALAPAFITLAAAIGVTAAALGRLYETQSSNRNFQANLALLGGEGGLQRDLGVTAEQLTRVARRVEELGFAFDDARKNVLLFLREGITPASLEQASLAAARLSRALGVDMAEAGRLLARALTEGSDGLKALEEAGFRFTETERRTIIEARNLSNEFERQQQILSILSPRLREADREGLSPLRDTVTSLKNAWRGFLDELGQMQIFQLLKAGIDGVVSALGNMRNVGRVVANSLIQAFFPLVRLFEVITRGLRSLGRAVDEGPPITVGPDGVPATPTTDPNGDGRSPSQRTVGGMTPGQRAADDAAANIGLRAISQNRNASRQQRIDAAVERAVAEFRAQYPQALDSALRLVATAARQEIEKTLDDEARAAGNAANAAIRRDFQAIAQDLQNTIRIRDDAIRGVQEDVATGGISAAEGIRRIQQEAERARPAIERLRNEAQRFLQSGRGGDAVRDAATQRVISQAERELSGSAAGGRAGRVGAMAILQQQQQEIQRQFQERAQFIQTQNALEQQNLITREEAERRIVAMYGETRDALQANIEAYRQASAAAAENGYITQAAAAGNAAQIELWNAQLERINPQWARMKQGIENVIGQSAMTAFDTIAKSLGDLIAGVSELSDVWDAAGRAALQFVADVLKGIAQIILQEQILMAVRMISKAVSGGLAPAPTKHAGGVIGQPGGQVRHGVNPAVFAGAPRMHDGGVVGGLRADERAAILQTGEEVLTRDDPRNILNRNKSGTQSGDTTGAIRNVLAIGDDEIASAMNGSAGEKVIFNILKRNAPTLRSMVRG